MNVSTDDAVASSDRQKKRNEIMNNKYLNAWQKKHLLDEMDVAESKPAAKAPQQPPKQPGNKDKPKIVSPANPFTYLNGPSKPPAPTQTPPPPAVTKPEPPPRPGATPAPAASQPKAGSPAENPKPPSPQVNPYEKRKQEILGDKSLNAHQKRYLLDELEAKYGNGSAAAPSPTPTVTVPYGLNGGDRQKAQDIAANDSMSDSQKKAQMGHYEQKTKDALKVSRYNQLLQEIVNDDSLTPGQKKRQADQLDDRFYPSPSAKATTPKQDIELSQGDMFFLQNNAGAAEIPENQRIQLMLKLQKDGQVTGEGLTALGIDAGDEADYYAAYLTLAYKAAQAGMTYDDLDTAYWEEKTGQGVAAALANAGTSGPEEGFSGRMPKGKMGVPGRPVVERPVEGAGSVFTKGTAIPDEVLKTKPSYSPDVNKWLEGGGKITVGNGTWKYTNSQGTSVTYKNGYPDFKGSGYVEQEVNVGSFTTRASDYKAADKLAPNGRRSPQNTWHHNEDGKTMQEVNRDVHRKFSHKGGMSNLRKGDE